MGGRCSEGVWHRRPTLRLPRVAGWLHTLRDRLTVDGAARFAAQLPELLPGAFYDGWEPARVPVKYGPDEYVFRFAEEAQIPVGEVRQAAAIVTHAVGAHLSPGQLAEAPAQLPHALRSLLLGSGTLEQGKRPRASGGDTAPTVSEADEEGLSARLERVEAQVTSLVEAVSILARSLETIPGQEPDEQSGAKAARLAHEILLVARAVMHGRPQIRVVAMRL